MKIISLNIGHKNTNFKRIARFLDLQNADFVFFQEVPIDKNTDAVQEINNLMDKPYEAMKTEGASTGLGVLSRPQEVISDRLELKEFAEDKYRHFAQNVMAHYFCSDDRDYPCETYSLTNVGFSNNLENWQQLKEVIDHNNRNWQNDIIVGNFNMGKEALLHYKYFWGAQFRSSAEFANYVSVPGGGELSQIDFCLIPRDMKFVNIETYEGLGQHNGVVYEIDLTNEEDVFGFIYPNKAAGNFKIG